MPFFPHGQEATMGTPDTTTDRDDPTYWCALAAQARVGAVVTVDPKARRIMCEIAIGYERLAILASKQRNGNANTS
jgi:hypothetical protein